MWFNPRKLLIIDLAVIALWVIVFFFAGPIGDALHPSVNRAFYQEQKSLVDQLYDPQISSNERNDKAKHLNAAVIAKSRDLYGVALDGRSDSLSAFAQAAENASSRWIYRGDRTMLVVYLGELIRAETATDWFVADDGLLALRSSQSAETISPYEYVDKVIYGEPSDINAFCQDALSKLGVTK